MKMLRNTIKLSFLGILTGVLVGCTAGVDNTGVEYAPQMYHSIPYEPLTQIQDEEAGAWLDSNPEDGHGEFYNSNPINPYKMNMLLPVEGTIKRGEFIGGNSIDPLDYATAEEMLLSPYEGDESVVKEGKALYERFCIHCHGTKGLGDGKVGKVYLGITAYTSATVKDKKAGHIYWVITNGKGRMGAHDSQISVDDRWKIVSYVQTLQKQ